MNLISEACAPCSPLKSGPAGRLGTVTCVLRSVCFVEPVSWLTCSCAQANNVATNTNEPASIRSLTIVVIAAPFCLTDKRYDPAGTKTFVAATNSTFVTSVLTRTLCSPGFFSGLARNASRYWWFRRRLKSWRYGAKVQQEKQFEARMLTS